MLHLKLSTDPRWVNLAEKSIEEILIDHAFCEQKAATSCISLIVTYSYLKPIVDAITPVVREEWDHFSLVLQEIYKRGFELGKPRKDEYVNKLLSFQKRGVEKEIVLVDKLLTNALIEARSCERFKLLSQKLSDSYYKKFYHSFMVSEASHYRLFMDLAKIYKSEEYVKKRWEEFLNFENKIMTELELRGDRMH
tara:strand:+ start:14053 stop:14634 length:582 start_codon:yes stop_codon:yes gene_type:complete